MKPSLTVTPVTARPDEDAPPMESPKLRLILAAEECFAKDGIERTSLRDISSAAGNKNKFAVQYHFKDRDGLILAILNYRRPQGDRIRSAYIDRLRLDLDACHPETLIRCLLQPLLHQDATYRGQVYTRFLCRLTNHDGGLAIWSASLWATPFTRRIYDELRRRLSLLPDEVWNIRMVTFGRVALDMISNLHSIAPARAGIDDFYLKNLEAILYGILFAPARVPGGSKSFDQGRPGEAAGPATPLAG